MRRHHTLLCFLSKLLNYCFGDKRTILLIKKKDFFVAFLQERFLCFNYLTDLGIRFDYLLGFIFKIKRVLFLRLKGQKNTGRTGY